MKREIDVWIDPEWGKLSRLSDFDISITNNERNTYPVKAKLIIDIPEQKIELTAREIVDAFVVTPSAKSGLWVDEFMERLGFSDWPRI